MLNLLCLSFLDLPGGHTNIHLQHSYNESFHSGFFIAFLFFFVFCLYLKPLTIVGSASLLCSQQILPQAIRYNSQVLPQLNISYSFDSLAPTLSSSFFQDRSMRPRQWLVRPGWPRLRVVPVCHSVPVCQCANVCQCVSVPVCQCASVWVCETSVSVCDPVCQAAIENSAAFWQSHIHNIVTYQCKEK